MSERVWYRSLYWRIALGIIALLIAVLAVEAIAFVWIVSRAGEALSPRALQQSARALAIELETSLEQDPSLDLDYFIRERVDAVSRPVLLVWHDGRVLYAGMEEPPAWMLEIARARLDAPTSDVGRRRRADDGRQSSIDRRVAGSSPVTRGRRALGIAAVQNRGELAGVVAILPGPSLQTLVREFGPMLLVVAASLTIGGTAIAALLIFGPAHRRLRGLEAAAHHLGAGNSAARAPDSGGDEIAAVARSFNDMASDIIRRTEALQDADRARRQLLADVSHELMTPLTAMRGYLETLRLPGLPLEAPARDRYLGIVLEETLRLERLIGDLLDLARLEAGGGAIARGPVRVRDLFNRVRARHERQLEEKHVTLEAIIVPGAEQLNADGDRLEQALQNLAANALRHAPADGRILLRAEPDEGRIRLSVADTGPGIPPEHLPHVFDRFYKADAARATAGSGLGLSIVRAIVEKHGGEVRARSTAGVETVFEILLPSAPPP